MKHLEESLLSGVSKQVRNQDVIKIDEIFSWVKTHSISDITDDFIFAPNTMTVKQKDDYIVLRLKHDVEIPKFTINTNNSELIIYTLEKNMVINADILDFKEITINGRNLTSLVVNGNLKGKSIFVDVAKLETAVFNGQSETTSLQFSSDVLNLAHCRFPQCEECTLDRNILKSTFKQLNIDKTQLIMV